MAIQKTHSTVAQAIVKFLDRQYVERDGRRHKFFLGMWGIFGHGNIGGLGQALEEYPDFPYYQARNEQGMVHAAAAYAKQNRRLSTFACTSSVGPGATNMLTAAAGATINRLPVLLLPGDTFACRMRGPVLQELEHSQSYSISVNDCFRPLSRYWDRIYRYEQLPEVLKETMRILTSPSETGTVTLCLPQDVQAEAGLFDSSLFEETVHSIYRVPPLPYQIEELARCIQKSQRPLIIAGGGVQYSEAEKDLLDFCKQTRIPLVETQAGKGSLPHNLDQNLGAIGVTGTRCANRIAAQADFILCIGTRMGDFTTASGTQFAQDSVRFASINVDSRDAHKYKAFPLICDAKLALQSLQSVLQERTYTCSLFYQEDYLREKDAWKEIRSSLLASSPETMTQSSMLGILNKNLFPQDTVVSAAGSLPGDMHKLLNLEQPTQYHMEYGYSCMGYEIAGALGVRMQKKEGEVFVLVGDGSYLMMHTELVTALQENQKLIVILVVNDKFACIDKLSKSMGSRGFGNEFRYRSKESGQLEGSFLKIDYVQNAQSLGLNASKVRSPQELENALIQARASLKSYLIAVEVTASANVPGFDTKWKVPVAEIAKSENVQEARSRYETLFPEE